MTTFLSHASLSLDERRRAEAAFAEARDCVIVATSTLELGIDVGDLDRVVQINAPPEPRHIVAQQLLARCLQDTAVGRDLWPEEWNGLAPFDRSAGPIVAHLLAEGFVEQDGGMLFIGAEAEKRFGRWHFAGLTAVFTARRSSPSSKGAGGRHPGGEADRSRLCANRGRRGGSVRTRAVEVVRR